jgi:CheY-like chemotaxis protein
MRILVIDDDRPSRELAARLVDNLGHSPVTADDGAQGLALARSERPDLLLLDLYMPAMSGLEVVREIRADPSLRAVPVIAVSSGTTEDQQAALSAGCNEFLSKPYELAALRAAIGRHSSAET